MGDAFLAQPDDVMTPCSGWQKAQQAGNLKTNEQIKVSTQAPSRPPAPTTVVVQQSAPPPQVIGSSRRSRGRLRAGVQPDGRVRTVAVSGVPPYYYPPPPGTVLADHRHRHRLGVGIGVSTRCGAAATGARRRQHHVNRYNNINANRQLNVNNRRRTGITIRARGNTPYRAQCDAAEP